MAMIIKLIFIFIIIQSSAYGNELKELFKQKDYKKIVELNESFKTSRDLTSKELVMLSYAYRQLKKFREDVKFIGRAIKLDHAQSNKEILKKYKEKETLDAEDYPETLMLLYWNLYLGYAQIILAQDKLSLQLDKDKAFFTKLRGILSELEFREGRVEKVNDKIMTHLQYLSDKVYRFSASINIQYISWQHDTKLHQKSTNKDTGIIITNKGQCLGGDIGMENGFYHFFLDGCFLIGNGGVSAYGNPGLTYQQDVPATGYKVGPFAAMKVSSTGSRIGIGLPVIYTSQAPSDPSDPDYVLREESPLSYMASMNSRWQFDKWYLRIEFAHYIGKQQSFWGAGFGRQF